MDPSPAAHLGQDAPPTEGYDPWVEAVGLGVSLGVCLGAAALGGWLTLGAVEPSYPTLEGAPFIPPGQGVGSVWTMLYILMALAAWQTWRAAGLERARGALALFAVQLALSVAWSAPLSGLEGPGWALLEVVTVCTMTAWTMRAFARVDHAAALAMAPYLAWVVFAGLLDASTWWLG